MLCARPGLLEKRPLRRPADARAHTLIDAQRSLLSFQEQLSINEGEVLSNLIGIYKALGGGWTSFASVETREAVL